MEGLDFDEFLDHSPQGGGGGFLGNWKEDGSIIVWPHPRAKFYPIWSHRWYRVGTDKDDQPKIFSTRFNCIEHEETLKKIRFRHNDGTLEHPVTTCPHCLLLEHVRAEIAAGRISWTDVLFRVSDGENEIEVHAGGFTGQFQRRDLSVQEKKELRRAGIRIDESYKENTTVGLEYLFSFIADERPDEGCMVAMEKQSLGQKIKKAFQDRMDDYEEAEEVVTNWKGEVYKGREAGKPSNNPCALKLSYDESKQFSDKYDAKCFDKKQPTDAVKAQFDEDPPDVSRIIAAPDLAAHRASMEQFCLIDIPWDEIFKPAEVVLKVSSTKAVDVESEEDGEDDFPESWTGDKDSKSKTSKVVELVACDVCEKGMPDDALVCPHCGAEYEVDPGGDIVLKPKPEPKTRRRAAKS